MIELRVKKIYKLIDDYQEIFINNASQTIVRYEELQKTKRTIHKDTYNDIYILEAHKYYKIDFDYTNVIKKMKEKYDIVNGEGACENDQPSFKLTISPAWSKSGLLWSFSNKDGCFYVYNGGENMVLIQDNVIIGESQYG